MQKNKELTNSGNVIHSILDTRIQSLSALIQQMTEDLSKSKDEEFLHFVGDLKEEIMRYKEEMISTMKTEINHQDYLDRFESKDKILFNKLTSYMDLRYNTKALES